ncbi:MAG: hypothetical protein IKX41_01200 [Oscillospiraceae bacterium]|nr:hypothetical protein [Oscillospiraceae bacterium]
MVFADKLNFLIKLTNTTNKQLGELLNIHQSQISRMRSGARGVPGNGEYIRIMATHFASRITEDYQRSAIAEALGRPPLRLPVETGVLSVILTEWLIGAVEDSGEKAELYLRNYRNLGVARDSTGEEQPEIPPEHRGDVFVYYGEAGKRAAVYAFLGFMLEQREPQQIDISCDESLNWLETDKEFIMKVQEYMNELERRGFTCRRIVGPITDLDYTYASLRFRWLPYLLSGRAVSYYYPRLRDGVYRRTLMVARGKCALLSMSTGRFGPSRVTFFIKDPEVTDALDAEFADYLAMCMPHMNVFDVKQSPEQCITRFTEIQAAPMASIQRSNSLSAITMPSSVANSVKMDNPDQQRLFNDWYTKLTESFENVIKDHPVTDAIYLASPEEVAEGKVILPIAVTFGASQAAYTVERYLLHLRNILWYVENVPNYHLLIVDEKDEDLDFACIKESYRAVLVRRGDPYRVIEVTERNMVSAFSELLHRSLGDMAPDSERKDKAARIRDLIRRLEAIKTAE